MEFLFTRILQPKTESLCVCFKEQEWHVAMENKKRIVISLVTLKWDYFVSFLNVLLLNALYLMQQCIFTTIYAHMHIHSKAANNRNNNEKMYKLSEPAV